MSIALTERMEYQLAIETLKATVRQANLRASRWESWAIKLEIQMMREGWTEDDIKDLGSCGVPRPDPE